MGGKLRCSGLWGSKSSGSWTGYTQESPDGSLERLLEVQPVSLRRCGARSGGPADRSRPAASGTLSHPPRGPAQASGSGGTGSLYGSHLALGLGIRRGKSQGVLAASDEEQRGRHLHPFRYRREPADQGSEGGGRNRAGAGGGTAYGPGEVVLVGAERQAFDRGLSQCRSTKSGVAGGAACAAPSAAPAWGTRRRRRRRRRSGRSRLNKSDYV